jgi:hypothetical protein
MSRRPAFRRELATILALVALPVVFFAPVWASARVFVSDGQYEAFFAPLANWSNAWIGGWPAGADTAAYVWYPIRVALLHAGLGFDAFVIGAYVIAALGVHVYLRLVGLGIAAAVFGAVSFAFSGFMVAQFLHTSMIHAAAWVPWTFAGVEGCLGRGARRFAMLTAAAVALACLAGHMQIAFYGLVAVVAYWLVRARTAPRAHWLLAGGGLVLGVLLAAPQLVFTMRYVRDTPRVAIGYDDFVAYSLPLRQVSAMLFPFLFGAPGRPLGMPYVGADNFNELTLAMPFLSIVLALAGSGFGRRDLAAFWWALALVALVLALGGNVPTLARLVYRLPGFAAFRVPARHAMELCLALSVLAAFGLERLLQDSPQTRRRWLGLAAALAVVVAIASMPMHRAAIGAAAAFRIAPPPWSRDPAIWSGLGGVAVGVVGMAALARGGRIGATGFGVAALLGVLLWATFSDWRVGTTDGTVEATPLERDVVARVAAGGGRVLHTQGGWRTRFTLGRMRSLGVPSLNWYGPLVPARALELVEMSTNGVVKPRALAASNQVLDVYGVRWAAINDMSSEFHVALRAALVPPRWRLSGREGDTTVYENVRALPLAWLCSAWRAVGPDEARRLLQEGGEGFDAAREALVTDVPSGGDRPAVPGTATARWSGPGAIVAEVDAATDGFLVVSVNGLPGWTATVDGVAQPLHQTDYALTGLPVAAGRHRVALVYRVSRRPLVIAWSAALLVGAACAFPRSRRRKGASRSPSP